MSKKNLFTVSGHWEHYHDGMFIMGEGKNGEPIENEEIIAMRPMTCPFQYEIYNASHHSYRDLPVRYNETSTLFRNEASGEMHGLIRIRQFTLSEGHIICMPQQLAKEFEDVIDLIKYVMRCLGIEDDISYRFSKWDENDTEKYIGSKEDWEASQGAMKKILDHVGLGYTEADGEAAFYGPKLDIQFRNVFGKEDTLFTIQVDFALAERFDMTYVDSDGQKKRPLIIHRSSIGCYERTLAMLIEKYNGALPLWMMSEQVRLMNITDQAGPYCHDFARKLKDANIRVTVDDRQEKIGYKIREARNERIPYMLIAGEKELAGGTFAIRRRGEGDIGSVSREEFMRMCLEQIENKEIF
jgi:threonyl-tRNA synthetase